MKEAWKKLDRSFEKVPILAIPKPMETLSNTCIKILAPMVGAGIILVEGGDPWFPDAIAKDKVHLSAL